MPLKYWGLDSSPFWTVLDVDHFYASPGHDEALARLEYLVEARRRLGVLLGEPGVGKSFTLRVAERRFARRGLAVVEVDATGLSTREFLWQIAAGLGAAPEQDADIVRLWRLVADRVVENRLQQVGTVLLVDEAGQAGPDVVTQVLRLARLDPTPAARWTIVLAAEPKQAAHWNETLRELVDLRTDLGPWRQEDTVGYVQSALVDAGRFEPLFDDDALRALHELAGGVPRRVARLADLALMAGAAATVERINAGLVHAASQEQTSRPVPAAAY